jgi:hypothetical protein
MTRAQAKEYLFKIPPTEPEVMKSFQDIQTFGFTQMDGNTPVGTVYRATDGIVGVYTIKALSSRTSGFYPSVEYRETDISDLEIPILSSDMMLDL